MKSNVQSLWISLSMSGGSPTVVTREHDGKLVREVIEPKPTCELRLGMRPGYSGRGVYDTYYAGLTEAQAKRLIDYLASEGFLKQAREPHKQKIPRPRFESPNSFSLQVSVHNGFLLDEELGWGPAMLKRLDGLRGVLEGDAAKAMDEILSRLIEERKQWEKDASSRVPLREDSR